MKSTYKLPVVSFGQLALQVERVLIVMVLACTSSLVDIVPLSKPGLSPCLERVGGHAHVV